VLFIGFQTQGTLGRKLIESTKRVGIDGQEVENGWWKYNGAPNKGELVLFPGDSGFNVTKSL